MYRVLHTCRWCGITNNVLSGQRGDDPGLLDPRLHQVHLCGQGKAPQRVSCPVKVALKAEMPEPPFLAGAGPRFFGRAPAPAPTPIPTVNIYFYGTLRLS